MVNKNEIRERMEVVGSCGNHLGTVDHLDGESIKMTRSDPNANGEHHWVPINWVESVDDKVHLSKNCSEAQNEWSRSTPTGSKL